MSNYILSCCSTADLSKEHFDARDIRYLCFTFTLGENTYPDDLGISVPFEQFYQSMNDGLDTRTSQINVEEYIAFFRGFLQNGQDILHVDFSSGLSGSVNSARIAADMIRDEFPDRKLYIVDSLAASSGYGLIMDKMADLRDAGMDIDTAHAWIEEHHLNMHHWFFSTDLKFYIKGGRVSKASGFVGGLLSICPLLNMDFEGHLIPREKIRSKKNVIKRIVEKMEAHADGGLAYADKCYISQSACYDDARLVADLVEEKFPNLKGKVEINHIGTTIGSHTGPGTVALFFWGDKREN